MFTIHNNQPNINDEIIANANREEIIQLHILFEINRLREIMQDMQRTINKIGSTGEYPANPSTK